MLTFFNICDTCKCSISLQMVSSQVRRGLLRILFLSAPVLLFWSLPCVAHDQTNGQLALTGETHGYVWQSTWQWTAMSVTLLLQRQDALMSRRRGTLGCDAPATWSRSGVLLRASAGRWRVLADSGKVRWVRCVAEYLVLACQVMSSTRSLPTTRTSRSCRRFRSVSHRSLVIESGLKYAWVGEFQKKAIRSYFHKLFLKLQYLVAYTVTEELFDSKVLVWRESRITRHPNCSM